jgi:MFS family permease
MLTTSRRVAQGWPLVLALFVATTAVEAFGFGQIYRFLPLYLQELGTPNALVPRWTGLLTATTFLLGLPLVPFWGVWADKYSRKLVIIRSAYVEALVFTTVGLSQNRYQLAGALLLIGFQLGNSGVMLSALRAATPVDRVGFATGILGAAPALGFALGPIFGGVLVDQLGWDLRYLFFLDGALSVATALMLTLGYREVRPANPPTGSAWRLAGRALRLVFTTRVTVGLLSVFLLVMLAQQIALPFFPLVVRRLHPDLVGLASTIGIVLGLATLAGTLLSPIAGLLGDRFGLRRALVASVLLAGVSLVLIQRASALPLLAVAALLFSASATAAASMIFALLAIRVPEDRRSTTLNLVYLPLYLAGIIGGSLGSILVQGGLDRPLLAGALLMLGAVVLALSPDLSVGRRSSGCGASRAEGGDEHEKERIR